MIKESHIPNMLTILRIILTPVFLYLLYLGTPAAFMGAFFAFLVASLSDWADGSIARRYGYGSEFGKFMDPLADKILVISTFIAFGLLGFAPWWMVSIIILRDIVITGVRTYMSRRGKSMRTSGIAKVKTAFQMVFIYTVLVYLFFNNFSYTAFTKPVLSAFYNNNGFWILMLLTSMFTLYTGILYFFENKHIFNSDE